MSFGYGTVRTIEDKDKAIKLSARCEIQLNKELLVVGPVST